MGGEREWLARYSWEFVTAQNLLLCQAKGAQHKPTSDGYETTRSLWDARHRDTMPLHEAVDLCRKCHRMATFCFYKMKILCLSDLHGERRWFEWLLAVAPEYDLVSIAGDLLDGFPPGGLQPQIDYLLEDWLPRWPREHAALAVSSGNHICIPALRPGPGGMGGSSGLPVPA